MSDLTPELKAEIEQILRTSSPGLTHGEIFRYRERGLNAEEIATAHGTSLSNIKTFIISLNHLLGGTTPTTKSAARRNSYVYKELLNHYLSPALRSYVDTRLRQLMEIDPEITMDPLRTRTHNHSANRARRSPEESICPACHVAHAGECY